MNYFGETETTNATAADTLVTSESARRSSAGSVGSGYLNVNIF